MSTLNKLFPALLIACVAGSIAPVAAQTASTSSSNTYSLSRGDSDAGATLYANSYVYARKTHRSYSSYKTYYGYGRASATARLSAKFLGSSRTVANFSGSLRGYGTFKFYNSGGWNVSCNQNGSVYLRLGGTTLWNSSFTYSLNASKGLTLRVVSPVLVVPAGGILIALHGRLNGSVSTWMDLDAFGCHFNAKLNGEAAASASGAASAFTVSPVSIGATVAFTVNRQALRANIKAQPPVAKTWSHPYYWLKGTATFKRGSMGANVKVWAWIPVLFIPIKHTTNVASWYLGAATKTLFRR